jgi:choline kinase
MAVKLQGAIIAAGRGERLRRSAGADIPKPLVELGGETLLVRQARAMLAAGAASVVAVINSETAERARELKIPQRLRLIVRDTPNSMETLFTLGEVLAPGRFVAATVDAVLARGEFVRFVGEALALTNPARAAHFDGVLAVTRWRGDKHPLFTKVTDAGLIRSLGDRQTDLVTAGFYLLPTAIFRHVAEARARKLAALREFLAMLIGGGIRLGALEVTGAIDIDEAADLDAALRAQGGGR